jgi:hypothetical protein
MRIVTWNVRSFYRLRSLTAATRKLATYTLDIMGVWNVRGNKDTKSRGLYFSYGRKGKSSVGNRIFCKPQNCISSYKDRVC